LFSVDYPFENCSVAAEFIETAPITEAVRTKVCHTNAESLLKL
jgi:2,3-dihydroxybenzoate decarboxylase